MEGLIILILLAVFVAPLILSIVAVVKVYGLQSKLEEYQRIAKNTDPLPTRDSVSSTAEREAKMPESPLAAPSNPVPANAQATSSSTPQGGMMEAGQAAIATPAKIVGGEGKTPIGQLPGNSALELVMGVKAAAFVGITILVIGISLLITYAIQNAWLGPGARSMLGVLCGAMLVALGNFAEQRREKYRLLARVLTGGGGSLFFVSVYAAYGMYHLIPAPLAGLGLLACAAAVFSLAMVYRSQAVAVLGVVGAFLVPMLVSSGVGNPTFLLAYVALLNVPVILLGLRRKWQWLYNLGFVSTVLYFLQWMDLVTPRAEPQLWLGLGFATLYYLQYAGLGILKLWRESQISGRGLDTLRLLLGSALLLIVVYELLDGHPAADWIGAWFLLYALLHLGLAWMGFRRFPYFTHEILAFLSGATLFAALALPAQLDGAWVSIGWAVEGVILAWMAGKSRSGYFRLLGFFLGFVGILKGLCFDPTLYLTTPDPFLNVRFWIGLASAALFGCQGWIVQREPGTSDLGGWKDLIWWIAILSALAVGISDTFWTIGVDEIGAWLLASWMVLLVAGLLQFLAPAPSSVRWLGRVLLVILPVIVFIFGIILPFEGEDSDAFLHVWIWLELLTVAMVSVLALRSKQEVSDAEERVSTLRGLEYSSVVLLLSIATGIGIISGELLRSSRYWGSMGITLFWAVSAFALTLWGLSRRERAFRYFGLLLFVLCAGKVMLVDSTQLDGLQRIGAYIGTGILLLLLSFMYQKADHYFKNQQKSQ